ncbi:MAG: DUF1028 domain-containing protein [Chromatiales bacterium]|jgi:uncharacterized Ntn-hydrolase superfamily protein|nr:DUF1028 domain-containing protein [Chromatiales bacterium]
MEYLNGFEFELGSHHHTFTAVGRCPRTGRLGISVTTAEMGVGGRVPFIMPNVGAVATQAYTDPRLGALGLRLLELGYPAQRVMEELESSDPHIEWRQLGMVDRWGHTAVKTGENNSSWAGHDTGDGWVVMGNALVNEGVVAAMSEAMRTSSTEDIETRLMRALDAGTAAGGQPDGQRSAAVIVYENEGYAIINLRVDEHEDPMHELWRLFNKLHPLVPYYRERPDNPTLGRVADWAHARGILF